MRIRIDQFAALVNAVDETHRKFMNTHGQGDLEGSAMAAYSEARKALDTWVIELVAAYPMTSSTSFRMEMPQECWPSFKATVERLAIEGRLHRMDIHKDCVWSCAHPDIRPIPSDPHMGYCAVCKEEGFPLTHEAAWGTARPEDREKILRNALETILKCQTIAEVHEQAHAALDAAADPGDVSDY